MDEYCFNICKILRKTRKLLIFFFHKTTETAASYFLFNIYFKFEVSYLMAPVTRDYWRETIFYTDLYRRLPTVQTLVLEWIRLNKNWIWHMDIYIYVYIYFYI